MQAGTGDTRAAIRVLFIEDDVVDQAAFRRAVQSGTLPWDCRFAGSLGEARGLVEAERFDIIVTDNLLGDDRGMEVLGWSQEAPVIIVTGGGSESIAVQAMKSGASDYMVKHSGPEFLEALCAAVENAIRRRQAENALKRAGLELQERAGQLEARNAELARLGDELQKQVIRDPLTGLFNRRHLEAALDREVRRAVRRKAPLSVIMLDIDDFKRVNDTFGHAAGDLVLRELGKHFGGSIRAEDVACRYGGEEFCLILPDCSPGLAQQRTMGIVNAFGMRRLNHAGTAIGPVTSSAGVAAYPDHGASPGELLEAADRALYHAKSDGRDRVVIYRPGSPRRSRES
jgi:diguanylate cyclase (GGDEF)-like protein